MRTRTAEPGTVTYGGREIDSGPNAANPRGANQFRSHHRDSRSGRRSHGAEFSWEVFLLAGDPSGGRLITDLSQVKPDSAYYAGYAKADDLSPIGSPDNIGFDRAGNLWMVTDGAQPGGSNNGCWVCPTAGPNRGRLQQFMSGPVGCEVCGCQFSPDGETLFLSIQHPGEGGTTRRASAVTGRTAAARSRAPASSRSRKDGGGVVGS